MKHYTIRYLIDGYKLKKELRGIKLVGIPYMANRNTSIMVNHKGIQMLINSNPQLFHKEIFKDKFNRNKQYILYYYEWLPNKRQMTLFP